MQVYVHLAGKNHGPYSIDQLRQYVQAGNFRDDHLACYDGTNCVKIKDVPGVAVEAKKAQQKTFSPYLRIRLSKCTTATPSRSIYHLSILCLAMTFPFVLLALIHLN
jgi:hypothetical protein